VGLLNSIAKNGYTAASFQITQVHLDRSKDLFEAVSELRRKTPSQATKREETGELIIQLREENSKLNFLLEKLANDKESERRREYEREKENLGEKSGNHSPK
jgi:hypothetical protein